MDFLLEPVNDDGAGGLGKCGKLLEVIVVPLARRYSRD
jgi:hypothetical protein